MNSARIFGFAAFLLLGASPCAPAAAAADNAAAAKAGETLYAAQCAVCHGPALRNPGGSFDLRALKPNEKPRFEKAVYDGKGQMPPWRGILTQAQLNELWAYLRTRAYE
jgi:mono/diheme cytochrome c family protein